MKTHDLRDLTMSDAYDKTQTSDEIRDGDILLVRDGVAIMVEAWPVMAEGISAVFHNVSHGFHAETSEKYAAAFAAAAALKSVNKPQESKTMNDQLLNQFDMIESQLVALYSAITHEMAIKGMHSDEYAALLDQRRTVKDLLWTVRDTLRAAAPELYTDF